jgi:hypothetical protein
VAVSAGDTDEGAPSWSPDGRSIVHDKEVALQNRDLFVATLDGSGGSPRALMRTADVEEVRPSWSSDGGSVYYGRRRVGQSWEIWVKPLGGSARRVAEFGFEAHERPGGAELYFVRQEGAGLWRKRLGGAPRTSSASPRTSRRDAGASATGRGLLRA